MICLHTVHTCCTPHAPCFTPAPCWCRSTLARLLRLDVLLLPHSLRAPATPLQDRCLDQRRLRELANIFQAYDEAEARRGSGGGRARAAHRGGTRIRIRVPSSGAPAGCRGALGALGAHGINSSRSMGACMHPTASPSPLLSPPCPARCAPPASRTNPPPLPLIPPPLPLPDLQLCPLPPCEQAAATRTPSRRARPGPARWTSPTRSSRTRAWCCATRPPSTSSCTMCARPGGTLLGAPWGRFGDLSARLLHAAGGLPAVCMLPGGLQPCIFSPPRNQPCCVALRPLT